MTSEKLGQCCSHCCPHWSLYLASFSYWGRGVHQCLLPPPAYPALALGPPLWAVSTSQKCGSQAEGHVAPARGQELRCRL